MMDVSNSKLKFITYVLIFVIFIITCNSPFQKEDKQLNNTLVDSNKVFYPNKWNTKYFNNGNLKIKNLYLDTSFHFQIDSVTKGIRYSINKIKFFGFNVPIILNQSLKNEDDRKPPFYIRDWIEIGNKKFCLDSLFYNKNILLSSDPIFSGFYKLFTIETQSNKHYLVLFTKNLYFSTTYSDNLIFLFDVSDSQKIIPYSLGYTKCRSIKGFGTYTNNGLLNFVNISTYNDTYDINNIDTIFTYQINGSKIEKIKEKFILITDLQGIGESYIIDEKRSKWWY